jgi:hypothetical protein
MSDDPYADRLREKAAYHHERASYWRTKAARRFDNAPGSFVTGSAGRKRSGLAKRSEKAIEGSFSDGRRAQWHEAKAARLEMMIAYREAAPLRAAERERSKQQACAERKALKAASWNERLFVHQCATGICYVDKGRERHGDWIRLAILFEDNLQLVYDTDCLDAFKPLIEHDAQQYQMMRGQEYIVSGSGQTVTLGYALKDGEAIPATSTVRVRAGR